MRWAVVAIAIGLAGCSEQPQPQPNYVDPVAAVSGLLQKQINDDARQEHDRQQNDAMRLRYQRASNAALVAEFDSYCPGGKPPCVRSPPDLLVEEAAKRGLIEHVPTSQQPQQPRQPGTTCVAMGDEMGGGIIDCQ